MRSKELSTLVFVIITYKKRLNLDKYIIKC